MKLISNLALLIALSLLTQCGNPSKKIRVIFDTDTNNELDDQHALAYLLFNQETFRIQGITINATSSGGNIDKQYEEARRVLQLCNADTLPVFKGADQPFWRILPSLDSANYDGKAAVDFIISEAKKSSPDTLTIIAVGKLTNIALALTKDPSIAGSIRLVWLGSNYPEGGEHNQNNDTLAMNLLLNRSLNFEMVTVRYGRLSGTSAVTITKDEIKQLMPGRGPRLTTPITGRHGGEFNCFGDYSVSLFENIEYHSKPPTRSLFDMAAVAIVKNKTWAQVHEQPAPVLIEGAWVDRPNNPNKIKVWENFNRKAIIDDFIASIPKSEK